MTDVPPEVQKFRDLNERAMSRWTKWRPTYYTGPPPMPFGTIVWMTNHIISGRLLWGTVINFYQRERGSKPIYVGVWVDQYDQSISFELNEIFLTEEDARRSIAKKICEQEKAIATETRKLKQIKKLLALDTTLSCVGQALWDIYDTKGKKDADVQRNK